MKSYKLTKTDFEFRSDNVEWEFTETIEFVFVKKNTLFFVFKKGEEDKNQKKYITKYYKNKGWKNIKFLKK